MAYRAVESYEDDELDEFRVEAWLANPGGGYFMDPITADKGRLRLSFREMLTTVREEKRRIVGIHRGRWSDPTRRLNVPGIRPGDVFYQKLSFPEIIKVRIRKNSRLYNGNNRKKKSFSFFIFSPKSCRSFF